MRDSQLTHRNVHSDRAGAPAGQPGRDIRAAAAELHGCRAGWARRQHWQLRLGDAPHSPVRLVGRPSRPREAFEPGGHALVPLTPGDRYMAVYLARHGSDPIVAWCHAGRGTALARGQVGPRSRRDAEVADQVAYSLADVIAD